jgi:hypothetical protein
MKTDDAPGLAQLAGPALRGERLEYLHEKVQPSIVILADFNLTNQPTDCATRLRSTRVTFGYQLPCSAVSRS